MGFLLAFLLAQAPDYLADGAKALDAKQYQAAADLFTKAIEADPKDYAAHFQLALAYSLLQKDPEAVAEYKSALELKPGLYEAELNAGMCLMRLKDANSALPYLKSAAEQKPTEFRPALFYAQALLDDGHPEEAQAAFTAAIALNGSSAAAELGLGESLARQNQLAEAEPHYRKAAAIDPAYKPALLHLADLDEQAHQNAAAIAIYREFPENAAAQERRGALLQESGRAADAIPALEAAVAKTPTAANRIALAQAYAKSGHPEKAIPLVHQALVSEPQDFELRMYYGRLLRDQRKFGEAAEQFAEASKLKPADLQPWNELTGVLVTAGQYPQALSALDRVRALGGETPAHVFLRAISYDHLHQRKEALASYKAFLQQDNGKEADNEFKARQRVRMIENEMNRR